MSVIEDHRTSGLKNVRSEHAAAPSTQPMLENRSADPACNLLGMAIYGG
jgi:hypothetical protein